MPDRDKLRALARVHGIEPGYHDIWGHWHEPSAEALRAVLGCMQQKADDDAEVEALLREAEQALWREVLPRAVVVRGDLAGSVVLRIRAQHAHEPLSLRLALEGGEVTSWPLQPTQLRQVDEARIGGELMLACE